MQGKICRVNESRGFGFIRPDQKSEQDVFFHISELRAGIVFCAGLVGQTVSFDREKTDKGWQALDIFPVDPAPAATQSAAQQST
jgi:cold shock CspA family protein